ncbi:S9 family peptidase [Bifidobacterium crudilactis]|jgi:dipeptidyl-peptidase-4|uniref:S9 family peptidase n=1 Tax=Bifidobacterium crudilactis TaxID=327277 RepID=A0A971CZX6_9BIFI|nr:alpha/beta fold hydrolase [Bifidobacterium crudilactis]MCI1868750.1 prolyl oligopeptidase family serine peptidase [Bifidobacterium crudilactis]MDN5972892.1 prolyl oligopeptidase family serine peptidase [Bifidobacterium crudilactis]MDN6000744.1 prolyl oligopeptidase family serine peptidase [Bifidobacterium crudilactis]MDN6208804.1 prolyl oligopeptidase family serine peptidase [Bifidobacterium crudilactis]MDN6458679.1 prolyl oligopeptidase family serine peptidase [Bifidobacterium crudilactis]
MGESKHTLSNDVISDFPGKRARTLRFSLGAPRSAQVIGDGSRALFLRSDGPEDLATSLWISVFDEHGEHAEHLLADPRELLGGERREEIPAEERARRERAREGAEGIVSFSVDDAGDTVVFPLDGRLWAGRIGADADKVRIGEIPVSGGARIEARDLQPVLNPRISPDGTLVAYTTGRKMVVVPVNAGAQAKVVLDVDATVRPDTTVGLAEFVAGEEMDRYEGFWWSPDSDALLVERADESRETMWYISDPANPDHPAVGRRYPRALTDNAEVDLVALRLSRDSGPDGSIEIGVAASADVHWDQQEYEYLAALRWQQGNDPLALVQNRLQNKDRIVTIPLASALDSAGGEHDIEATVLLEHGSDTWIDLFAGCPCRTPRGELISAVSDERSDTNRLEIDGKAFTPAGWQLRELLDVDESGVLVVASQDPRSFDVVAFGFDGSVRRLNERPGVWTASRASSGMVLSGRDMDNARSVMTHSWVRGNEVFRATIGNHAAEAGFAPRVQFLQLGGDRLQAAVIRPSQGSRYEHAEKLPVLLKPYGGPGFQQVVYSQAMYLEAQWWADQGFIVLTADGHGTTGRGPSWDRAIFKNMAEVTLNDQIAALHALPEAVPEADLEHVAMIGWSYGGFLSALAVLRAPEAVHAACAGAPPTDWTLYDTHYTERYLGLDPQVYEDNSLLDDAAGLKRPLMLIHGFADDNVSVANTLRLSQALLAAGRDHTVLPLNGITHMTNDETVAENLLLAQRDFLYQALGMEG